MNCSFRFVLDVGLIFSVPTKPSYSHDSCECEISQTRCNKLMRLSSSEAEWKSTHTHTKENIVTYYGNPYGKQHSNINNNIQKYIFELNLKQRKWKYARCVFGFIVMSHKARACKHTQNVYSFIVSFFCFSIYWSLWSLASFELTLLKCTANKWKRNSDVEKRGKTDEIFGDCANCVVVYQIHDTRSTALIGVQAL